MKKVIKKGYTLTIISWENDGDNYRTKSKTVQTREEAEKLFKICSTVFKSCNNNNGGVGNSMNGRADYVIINFVEENPEMFSELIDMKEDSIIEYFNDIGYELMGGSEYYNFRVCESCSVTYSPEDVYLQEITF